MTKLNYLLKNLNTLSKGLGLGLGLALWGLIASPSVFAQGAPGAAGPGGTDWSPLFGIALMIGVFFFLIILPQSRKAKKHAEFIGGLKKGDAVVTASGLFGRIYGLADKVVTLEIAPNVRVRVDRQTIVGIDPTGGEEKVAA